MELRLINQITVEQLKSRIRDVPNFPKPGVGFKDFTPLLSDAQALSALVGHMADLVPSQTTKLACIESRGFVLGSALAAKLGLGISLIRKPGKLPPPTISKSYDLEYGQDTLQIHKEALCSLDRVCIIDDVLATGGTASAAEALCLETGAKVSGFVFMMEIGFLNGRKRLKADARVLISY